MRRTKRPALPARAQSYLDRRERATAGAANVDNAWKAARQTKAMEVVVGVLRAMAGTRERCMYCVDSHGSDIEHFWPKSVYPDRTFEWPNMLLCCTECGRLKGKRFPLSTDGQPLLLDPSAEDPWECLDFDPDTGNITARYDTAVEAPSAKGETTVQVLQLDRREGMAEGYRKTYRLLARHVRQWLAEGGIDAGQLVADLREADDHGLMDWCFGPTGALLEPFDELRRRSPHAWGVCVAAVQQ